MSDDIFKRDMVTVEGSKYSLVYSPTELYHFSSKGNTPLELMGGFTGLTEALVQFDRYDRRLALSTEVKRVEMTEHVLLEDLTTKTELLSYADMYNIDVPEGLSHPKQIKKLLQASLLGDN
jgi:hypothetical protein|tara:strand:- start:813 stop:1175 length:363 start_codon:yes stop_codon:yes gene_type:complete